MFRDLALGLFAIALAAVYYAGAGALPVSLLADEVGADGVPKLLAIVLGICGAVQVGRAVLERAAAIPEEWHAHARALGLLLIGIAYVVLMPNLGYLGSTIALLLATALYAGQKPGLALVAVSVIGGVGLWITFAKVLGIGIPAGRLFG